MNTAQEEVVYAAVIEGRLEIDSDGRIWRVAEKFRSRHRPDRTEVRRIARRRAESPQSKGYLIVKETVAPRRRIGTKAHRLVFRHFKGPIPSGLTVNHKNGIKTDNRPENLELATMAEQVAHAVTVLGVGQLDRRGQRSNTSILMDGDAEEIRVRRMAGESGVSLAKEFGVSPSTVSLIFRGKRWLAARAGKGER